jgi:replication factor A1
MVRYHYALVDDLISREEFDAKIEQKTEECGNLIDETAAALLVVRDLGRDHVPISKLYKKSSLFCFFGKILEISKPKEFDKQDGSKGMVCRMIVGDRTGRTTLVFWDEQAMALADTFSPGESVEVIGKHGRNGKEIQPLNMRKSVVMIECSREPGEIKAPERRDIDMVLLVRNKMREYVRRDGTPGTMVTGLIGTNRGAFRFVCFAPSLLDDLMVGSASHIDSILEKEGDYQSIEFVIDDQSTVLPLTQAPDIAFFSYETIRPDTMVSVQGVITEVRPFKKFIRRDGTESYVRNIRISDLSDSTKTLPVVLWDEAGRNAWFVGEHIEIFFALAKIARSGDIEVSLGKGGLVRPVCEECSEFVDICGTILHTEDGCVLDNGIDSYLLYSSYPTGSILSVKGALCGARVFCESEKITDYSCDPVKERIHNFLKETK